jgi:hypothetical protein
LEPTRSSNIISTPNPSPFSKLSQLSCFLQSPPTAKNKRDGQLYPCLPQMSHCVHAPLALIKLRQLQLILAADCRYGKLKPPLLRKPASTSNRALSFPTTVNKTPSGTLLLGALSICTFRGKKIVIPNSRTQRPRSVVNSALFSEAGRRA